MDLTAFTADQLDTMARTAYKKGIQLYDQADSLMNELMLMPSPLTPAYRELKERYGVVRGAADEQAGLQMAISREIERRDILRRRDEILAEQQEGKRSDA